MYLKYKVKNNSNYYCYYFILLQLKKNYNVKACTVLINLKHLSWIKVLNKYKIKIITDPNLSTVFLCMRIICKKNNIGSIQISL